MESFTRLFNTLDQTTRTNDKVAALENYFQNTRPRDAAWALQFLSGKTPPRAVSTRSLRHWVADAAQLPEWMLAECYDVVGDLGETLALLFPESASETGMSLAEIVEQRVLPLRALPDLSRRELLLATWRELSSQQRLIYNKLITGEFRVGVSRTLVVRALANLAGVEPAIIDHRVLGKWNPTADEFLKLLRPDEGSMEIARPYPFFLASPIEARVKAGESIAVLGEVHQWQAEWKWDGIRAQLIRRNDEICIWSRGDEMVTGSFPEIAEAARCLPNGTVLDGELVAWMDGQARPFGQLQQRLGRKRVSARMRADLPVVYLAYDLLEENGQDIRETALEERRAKLETLIGQSRAADIAPSNISEELDSVTPFLFPEYRDDRTATIFPILVPPILSATSWEELETIRNQSRQQNVEGLMLKRRGSRYAAGRQRGDWWKWKVEPFTMDAVLIYAQRGHGRRAALYTDYTFGVWDHGELVPVAKAYSGLTDREIAEVDSFVRRNSTGKHGIVRVVKPDLVFELAFEGIQKSSRHRSGIALRFPRMLRWRHDKKPEEADTLETLIDLLRAQ